MRNFKLIRIDMRTSEVKLLEDNLLEDAAWNRSIALGEVEIDRPHPRYFFAVTSFEDWEVQGKAFIKYRRSIML
jgi:hypothetical protein